MSLNITSTQLPEIYREVIETQVELHKENRSITNRTTLPRTAEIPIENQSHWLKIPDVICVFVDMKGSTKMSAAKNDDFMAGAYQLFTGTAVRLFHAFEAPYIDLKGDGVFALFNPSQPYRALAAAVTFKTFAHLEFVPKITADTDKEIGSHIGIDQKTLLVRKIGLKRHGDRTDRQNEVWAGKAVNMAAKLASLSEHNQLLVSDRFFNNLKDDLVLKSCGCPDNEQKELWESVDVSEDMRFDFDVAYKLSSNWCETHGEEYCSNILSLDDDS